MSFCLLYVKKKKDESIYTAAGNEYIIGILQIISIFIFIIINMTEGVGNFFSHYIKTINAT